MAGEFSNILSEHEEGSYMFKELEAKNLDFSLKYYGANDYSTLWDIKMVLENKDLFVNQLNTIKLNNIVNIIDYLNYLCLRKLALFQEMIPAIKNDEDKQSIQIISDMASIQYKQIGTDTLVKFINCSYQEVFAEEYHKYLLPHITLELTLPVQNGLSRNVFEHLAKNYNYLLIDNFQDFHKRFEKEPQLFEMLFHRKNLDEIRELRFDCVFPVFVAVWNGNNAKLKDIIAPIFENIIQDTEKLIKDLDSQDSRNILIVEHQFREIYDFIKQIKHTKANIFHEYSKIVEEKLENSLKEHGQKFSYQIPVGEILEYLKNQDKWESQILSLTHDIYENNDKLDCISRLSYSSQGKQGLIDLVSSNMVSDDYFTHSHQNRLNMSLAVGTAVISAIWHDNALFPECLQWYHSALKYIGEQIECTENLNNDLEMLHVMLQQVILSDEFDKKSLSPLCYGAGMFTCALAEKILRIVYVYLLKDKMYVPLTSATLGSLMSPHNQEMVKIFGEDHLKNLSYFLCTVGVKKIGWNIRNTLAHWVEMRSENVNSMLVAQVFYLYTDIINTVFWYFLSLSECDNRDKT